MSGILYCPNCGEYAGSEVFVCNNCGKMFCSNCFKNNKAPQPGMYCPRCRSGDTKSIHDWNEAFEWMKKSQQ